MAARRRTRDSRGDATGVAPVTRVRMTGKERRQQLLDVARELFAEKGFDGTSIEEIAHRAGVSKPVVYEHFGGKEGVYAVVVDREMQYLLDSVVAVLGDGDGHPRELLERAARALLNYIEGSSDGFRIMVRDSPVASASGTFSSLSTTSPPRSSTSWAPSSTPAATTRSSPALYAQALVGMVALTGQWWLEVRKPKKDEVAAHLVNLAWNGLSHLEGKPRLRSR